MMKNMKLGTRITMGFAVVLIMLLALGGVALLQLNKASTGFSD